MITKFSDFDLRVAVRELTPARVFLRRRDPTLREVIRKLLPEGGWSFCEIADAPLLLRQVSEQLLSWEPGETLEITVAERVTSDDGARDILVGFRRPSWKRGAILVTALSRSPQGDEEEYGSALILGPGESVEMRPDREAEPGTVPGSTRFKLAS